jgi:hypothetical protein
MYNRQANQNPDFVARQIDYNSERRFGQKRKSNGLAVWRADVEIQHRQFSLSKPLDRQNLRG